MPANKTEHNTLAALREAVANLRTENNVLKADIGYWKRQHERALEREETLRKELQDKKARIKYLNRQLYEKKTERSRLKPETNSQARETGKRLRGHQSGTPGPGRRNQEHLPVEEEHYDLSESEKYCAICGLPFIEMPDTEDSEIIETQEVRGYRRKIRRKKYRRGCTCEGTKGIITAPGPAKLIPPAKANTKTTDNCLLLFILVL